VSALELLLTDRQDMDVLVKWPNWDLNLSGLKYPLTLLPETGSVYYDIEIHLGGLTIYHTSEIIEPFERLRCGCGAAIQNIGPSDCSPFYDAELPNQCPSCGHPMNYACLPLTIRDGFTGTKSKSLGGAAYRFAVVIDCGKCWPERQARVTAEFLATIEESLNIKTRVLRDFY